MCPVLTCGRRAVLGRLRVARSRSCARRNVYNAGGSRPPPAAGAPSTGETPFNNRLPTRSPGITPQRPRSADVDSDWPLGDGRQDPAADSGRVRAQHRPGPIIIEHHTTNGAVVWATETPTTTTRRTGPPQNTGRQRLTPFGPHWTHSCSLTRHGANRLERFSRKEAASNGSQQLCAHT